MMVRRFHTLGTGQFTDERLGIVDQHGKMLRTDPELPILEFECDQGNLLSRTITRNAMRFIRMIISHSSLLTCFCDCQFLCVGADRFFFDTLRLLR